MISGGNDATMTFDKFFVFLSVMGTCIAPKQAMDIFINTDVTGNGYLTRSQFQAWTANSPLGPLIELMTGLISPDNAEHGNFAIVAKDGSDKEIKWQPVKFTNVQNQYFVFNSTPNDVKIPNITQFKQEFTDEVKESQERSSQDPTWHRIDENKLPEATEEIVKTGAKGMITVKVIVFGATGTGKTSLIKRFVSNTVPFNESKYDPTPIDGAQENEFEFYHENSMYKFNIVDTSGMPGSDSVLQSLVSKSEINLLIAVFNRDDAASFKKIESQIELLDRCMYAFVPDKSLRGKYRIQQRRAPVLLVQTKADLIFDQHATVVTLFFSYNTYLKLVLVYIIIV